MSLYTELCAALGIGINEFLSGDDIGGKTICGAGQRRISFKRRRTGKQAAKSGSNVWVAALLIVSAAALSIIGAYLIRTNRPENVTARGKRKHGDADA